MAAPGTRPGFRRILVALDASPSSLEALAAAVRLAAELKAELAGLFVEDENLTRFAGLPFTRVIDSLSAQPRAFDAADLERELRAQAERARKALAEAAGTRVAWSFRVVRGRVQSELLAAAGDADLLSLGFVGTRLAGGARAGSLARSAALESPRSVLLLRDRETAGAPVAVWFDEDAHGESALDAAASLAKAQGGGLTVVTRAGNEDEARRIEAAVAGRLRETGLEPRYLHLAGAGERTLRAALDAAHGGVLVVSVHGALVADETTLRSLVETCSCSLLLTR